jgi:parallel beta-helix repeat protein
MVVDNDLMSLGAGISTSEANNIIVANNRVLNTINGIYIQSYDGGVYRDNVTIRVLTPYTGGMDAGNNK